MGLGNSFWIAALALLVSLLVGSRFLTQLLVYYLYLPYVFALGNTPNFRNESNRHLTVQVEYFGDISEVGLRDNHSYLFPDEIPKLKGGSTTSIRSIEFDLPPGVSSAPVGPFEVDKGEEIDIIIYPFIEASELGLPELFGKLKLKPVSQTFTFGEDKWIPDEDDYPPGAELFNGINHKLQWRIVSAIRRVKSHLLELVGFG